MLYLRDGERLVVCNVNPGFERPNPWTLNLRANPQATVQIGRNVFAVTSREATPQELERLWPPLVELRPAYAVFLGRGGKRSVFVLSPLPS